MPPPSPSALLISSLLAAVFVAAATTASSASTSEVAKWECGTQCPERCSAVTCAERRLDPCGCCFVCVRQANESCGPPSGLCATGLTCQRAPEEVHFTCQETWPEPCLKAKCQVVFQPKCPPDSRLDVPKSDDECCPREGSCVCDSTKCIVPKGECEPRQELVLVRKATDKPGTCCDAYECQDKAKDCSNVICEPVKSAEQCPPDSFRDPVYVPEGACCEVLPECQCKQELCQPAICGVDERVEVVRQGNGFPGSCCSDFRCVSDSKSIRSAIARKTLKCFDSHTNQTYAEGETVFRNPCEQCECRNGVIHCKQMSCRNLGKNRCSIRHPADECCPTCVACLDETKHDRLPGEIWQKDDCTTCTCDADFVTSCTTPICKVDCMNPRKVEGECCPVCDEPTVIAPPVICPSLEHCPLRCEHGLLKNQWGCFQCECAVSTEPTVHSDVTDCDELSEENCNKQCAHGYLRDQRNCPVCKCAKCPSIDTCYKQCLYGFETNSLGCPICKCRARSKIDARLQISEKALNQRSDSCVSVTDDNRYVERDAGEWWTDSSCRQCFCQHQKEFCSLLSCPARPKNCPSENWRVASGECCPSCTSMNATSPVAVELTRHGQTVCHSPGDGRLFVDGETWTLADCVSCTCRMGHVLCMAATCPPTACEEPVRDPTNPCCSSCSSADQETASSDESFFCMDSHGIARAVGDEWRVDECTSCRCSNNSEEPLCFTERCADAEGDCAGRSLMIKGRCCPVCSDTLTAEAICTYHNHTFSAGEEFRAGDCRNCTCLGGGRVECVERLCSDCPDAGDCCTLCADQPAPVHGSQNESSGGFTSIVLLLFTIVGFFGAVTGLVGIAVLTLRRRRGRQAVAGQTSLPTPKDPLSAKTRTTSESESANMSLLSNHSDTSTALSTNCPSDNGETTPLTTPRRLHPTDIV